MRRSRGRRPDATFRRHRWRHPRTPPRQSDPPPFPGGRGAVAQPRFGRGVRRPRRSDARRAHPRHRLRPRPPAVRRPHRVLPGGAASAGRRTHRHGRVAQRRAARRLGGRRARRRRRAGGRVGRQGLLRPRRPLRCARPPFRCTAASATRGSVSPTSSCGVRCCRARCSAAWGPTWAGSSPPADLGTVMDFADSPEEPPSACACASGSATTTRASRRPRRPTSTGRARPTGTGRSTTPASSACRGRPRSAGTGSRPSTR